MAVTHPHHQPSSRDLWRASIILLLHVI
jgi:hypothetical protein